MRDMLLLILVKNYFIHLYVYFYFLPPTPQPHISHGASTRPDLDIGTGKVDLFYIYFVIILFLKPNNQPAVKRRVHYSAFYYALSIAGKYHPAFQYFFIYRLRGHIRQPF